MSKQMKNFLTLIAAIIIGAFFVFIYNCIVGLSDFAGRINPALAPWVFWALFAAVAGSLAWLLGVAFLRPRPLLVYADPTPEEMETFRCELVKRLGRNGVLKDAGVHVRDESGLEEGLAVLSSKADEEIRSTAKRVFVGTAVSQNGRLDALVVLFLIARLVWRISKLYNQRPHHRELMNLYANIAVTAFLAGSIDEFGIEEYVHELMGPMIASSAVGAMPGAEAVAGTITASILSGSTNALLAMRCGIVARNYMSLELDTKGRMRRSATLEAARMFMSISGETVTEVTKLLVRGATGGVTKGAKKAARKTRDTVAGAAGSVGRGVKGSAKCVGDGVKSSAKGVKDSAKNVGDGVRRSVQTVSHGVRQTAETVGKGVKDSARSMRGKAVGSARTVVDGADKITDRAMGEIKRSASKVEAKAQQLKRGMSPAVEKAEKAAGKTKRFFRSMGSSVEQRVRKTRDAVRLKRRREKDSEDSEN